LVILAVVYGSGTAPFQENRSSSFSTYVKKINLKPNLNLWRHDCRNELGTTVYQGAKRNFSGREKRQCFRHF
jgi:hypothetical protein